MLTLSVHCEPSNSNWAKNMWAHFSLTNEHKKLLVHLLSLNGNLEETLFLDLLLSGRGWRLGSDR